MNHEIEPAASAPSFPEDETEPGENGLAAVNQLPVPHLPPVIGVPVRKPTKRRLVTTLTLSSRTCKWPFGDPAKPGFHYCGEPPQSGRPYCDTHDQMSYQPTPRKRPS